MSRHNKDKGPILSLVSVLSVVVFLILGFVYGLWHPGWIVFFATPVTAAILRIMGVEDKDVPKDNQPQ